MKGEQLTLFRNLVKNRKEHIRKRVLGFSFKVEISPNWGKIFEKQIEYIKYLGGTVTEKQLSMQWYHAELTGFYDYLLEAGDGTDNAYREINLKRFPNCSDLDRELQAEQRKVRDFIKDAYYKCNSGQFLQFGFDFENADWHENLPEKYSSTGSREYIGSSKLQCIFSETGISITPDLFFPLDLSVVLSYLNEIKMYSGDMLSNLPDVFLIKTESKYAPPSQKGIELPVAPGWFCRREPGDDYFNLEHPFCSIYIHVFPKVLRFAEWPEQY